jgi:hypothetical protein
MKNIICFLTVAPSKPFYEFAKTLQNDNYDVYICIDRNGYKIPDYDFKIPIIQIDNKYSEYYGYKNSLMYFKNRACARDKALYYFSMSKTKFKYLWLIEDDVFIPTINIIPDIDLKYTESDLLTSSNNIIHSLDEMTDWHWTKIKNDIKLPFPWSCSMICACRISPKLLECVANYAKKYKSLFLDEALFNTLCVHNSLTVVVIEELSKGITWREVWTLDKINEKHLYHPIKNFNDHIFLRKHLDNISKTTTTTTIPPTNSIEDVKELELHLEKAIAMKENIELEIAALRVRLGY